MTEMNGAPGEPGALCREGAASESNVRIEPRKTPPDVEHERVVDICDACQRIRTKWCDQDSVCKLHPGTGFNDCLARFYTLARKRLD